MHKKTRVLIVEKEKNVSAVFKLMLKDIFEAMKKGNFEINTTQDYDKAKRKLKNKKFDLLLYDVPYDPSEKVQLNKKVLEDLKLIHIDNPRLPIIATSTMTALMDLKDALKNLGVISCFLKPKIKKKQLGNAVEKALNNSSARDRLV